MGIIRGVKERVGRIFGKREKRPGPAERLKRAKEEISDIRFGIPSVDPDQILEVKRHEIEPIKGVHSTRDGEFWVHGVGRDYIDHSIGRLGPTFALPLSNGRFAIISADVKDINTDPRLEFIVHGITDRINPERLPYHIPQGDGTTERREVLSHRVDPDVDENVRKEIEGWVRRIIQGDFGAILKRYVDAFRERKLEKASIEYEEFFATLSERMGERPKSLSPGTAEEVAAPEKKEESGWAASKYISAALTGREPNLSTGLLRAVYRGVTSMQERNPAQSRALVVKQRVVGNVLPAHVVKKLETMDTHYRNLLVRVISSAIESENAKERPKREGLEPIRVHINYVKRK